MRKHIYGFTFIFIIMWQQAAAQNKDSLLKAATLQNCVHYAITHQPEIKQSQIDEEIAERIIKSKLADWFPQLYLDYSLQHNFELQTSVFQGNAVRFSLYNTSGIQFSATQNIFNRDLLLAGRTADEVRTQAKQNTTATKIDVVANVSKAFYDVLLTGQQIDLLSEDIIRLERSLKDAYNQYLGGIVDKIDYKRATILLNNSKAQQKQYKEALIARYAYLKQQMNYPAQADLNLLYDTGRLEQDAYLDTTLQINYENRIEYKQLQTQKRLQEANLRYTKWSYLPSVGLYGNYNLNFLNDQFTKIYSHNYPNSYAGLTLSLPIFEGTKRTQQIKQAELEVKRVDLDFVTLKNSINTQYQQALSSYKSNLNYYYVLKENLDLANDVYNTVQLQYKAGIKTYLEVITSETDLRTAQFNYINALYEVLSSKVDVERALGNLEY